MRLSRSISAFFAILLVTTACTSAPSEPPAPPAPEADNPPDGLGKRDDAATLGPYAGSGSITLLAHKSAEYSASVNSWLIEGPSEIGLFDAQMLIPEAEAVVELVKSRNKKLAWIWISHAHPDHYAGLGVIAQAFPEAPLLAHPDTAARAPELRMRFDEPLEKFFPGLLAPPVELTPYADDSLSVDGVPVRIVTFVGGEHGLSTALLIPDARAMLIADLVYNRVHPWLNEMDVDTLLAHVETLARFEMADTFYPGHGEPFGKDYLPTYVRYVEDFLAEVEVAESQEDLVARVWRRYRDWRTLAGLRFSATAHMNARREAEQMPAPTPKTEPEPDPAPDQGD